MTADWRHSRFLRGRWPVVVAVFALAVAVRLAFLCEVKDLPSYRYPQVDERAAHVSALSCVRGEVPSDSYLKAPLYMYFLGGVYWLFGPDPVYGRIVQAIVCSLAPVILFLLTERLFGHVAGVIAGVLGAVYWMFVFYAVELVDASLAGLLYLLLAYVLAVIDVRTWWHWLAAGVVMGLGAITRPNVLAFAPVLAIAALIATARSPRVAAPNGESGAGGGRLGWARGLVSAVALTVGCCAAIAPVTIRNRVVAGEWVLIAAYGGINFWVANNPEADGKNVMFLVGEGVPPIPPTDPNDIWSDVDMNNRIAQYHAEKTLGRPLRRGEVDRFCFAMGFESIRKHAGKFVTDTLRRFVYFFNAYEFPNVRDPYRLCRHSRVLNVLSYVHFGVLCPLLVVGVLTAATARDRSWPMIYYLAMLASLLLGGVFFVMNSRFRVPLVLLAAAAAAGGLLHLLRLRHEGVGWARRIVLVGALLATAVVSNVDFLGYRPPYHTDLRFAEALACTEAKDLGLLAEATPRFEEALEADGKTGRRTWSTLITHARPNSLLFMQYYLLKNLEKTFHYGKLMALHEPFDRGLAHRFFELLAKPDTQTGRAVLHMLMSADRREQAGLLLDLLSPYLSPTEELTFALRYGRRYRDAARLRRAEETLVDLVRKEPDDASHREMLTDLRALMQDWGIDGAPANPSAQPSSREDRPHDG